jgi:PAS domain-containing protein
MQNQIYVNAAGLRLYEKPAGEIIGRPLQGAGLSDSQYRLWTERIQKVFETGQPMETEDYLPTEKGLAFYLSQCVPEYGPDGAVSNVLVISRDLTERQKMKEELRESEEKYRNLFMNMTEEVHFWKLVRDGEGRITTWRLVDVKPSSAQDLGQEP